MNNTKKVLKYGKCFGKNFYLKGDLPVVPAWKAEMDRYCFLRYLFKRKLDPSNVSEVSRRINHLDLLYRTQLYRRIRTPDNYEKRGKDLYDYLADCLFELYNEDNFYKKIENGEPEAVTIIARELTKRKKSIKKKKPIKGQGEFSFASKYCFFLKRDSYPIYDSMAKDSLRFYSDGIPEVKTSKHHAWKQYLKELGSADDVYGVFKQVIKQFKDAFNLDVSYRRLDWYLWTFGKAIKIIKDKHKEKHKENPPRDVILSLIQENAKNAILSLQE